MSRKMKILLAEGGCLLVIVAVFFVGSLYRGEIQEPRGASIQDLSVHPIYSKYTFGAANENVIDFGIQPIGVQIRVISEVMRRDQVLIKALSDLGQEIKFHSFLKGTDVDFSLERGILELALGGDMRLAIVYGS